MLELTPVYCDGYIGPTNIQFVSEDSGTNQKLEQ